MYMPCLEDSNTVILEVYADKSYKNASGSDNYDRH